MGKNQADEMNFWTKEEFTKFLDAVMDKHRSYVGFKTLLWTGLRIGELLALTIEDIDFDAKTLNVSKSYQRIGTKDVITPPKTPKSNRIISIPEFLLEDLKDYVDSIYQPKATDRLFPVTKHYFEREMKRGVALSGVKKIRLHDCRHSHCALLFEMQIPPLEVAERLGHERVETTLNTYAHLYPNKQKHISEKLDKIYEEEY
ncbi:site-specific integrase [Anaerotignum propionicum]|uniref:site-specific integrase n=1 Tax=Anaerotignum propionicum TaxID=28446 RepID=UPI00289A9CB9|nr:site-specific integrase [Anaerotignum propionicum]